MYKIDLNSDLGESFGSYKMGMDDKVIKYVSSINAACGFHAADPLVMEKTVKLAKENGVEIGAHPGFRDLVGFGRRPLDVTPQEAKTDVLYQLGALYGFCKANGVNMQHVKPHGALYNTAAKDKKLATAICEAIYDFDKSLIVLGLAGSEMISCAKEIGLKSANEIFADRNYEEDGSLVNRRKENAMVTDETLAIERMVRAVKEGVITSVSGKDIEIEAHSICVHGDGEKALLFTNKIRQALIAEGVNIVPLNKMV